jgi:hypothetical protein
VRETSEGPRRRMKPGALQSTRQADHHEGHEETEEVKLSSR